MTAKLDMKVLELISARMCHDLISPVSAVSNGVELMTEFEDQMQGEALGLVGDSARAASRLLQYFRAAFGTARSADGSPLGLAEARQRAQECFGAGRIRIDWPDPVRFEDNDLPRHGVKLIMNMVLAALDLLPGSGGIELRMSPGEKGVFAEVIARKDGLVLTDAFRQALMGTANTADLTPRTVIAYFCHVLTASEGRKLEIGEAADSVTIAVALAWP